MNHPMQTICLFASDYDSPGALHAALQSLLSLPAHYGMNADALHDCLSERAACPGLWLRPEGPAEVSSALTLVARVFRDLGGEVKEI